MAKSDHKRHSAKHKIDRRLGVNLWGRPKSPVNAREYGPGQHGQRRKKPTDFGVQLMAKQKLKGYYGNIGEKQFKKYYAEAVRRRGDTGQNLWRRTRNILSTSSQNVHKNLQLSEEKFLFERLLLKYQFKLSSTIPVKKFAFFFFFKLSRRK